jgi:nitrite reductase/ring-hydroxylating ferredoxin subunit
MGRRLICTSDEVIERSKGVRFTVERGSSTAKAFVIRYGGTVYGYLNRCAHISVELDWAEGEFFDFTKTQLICATHGALYEPDSGTCVGGPCLGRALTPLPIEEIDGKLYLLDASVTQPTAVDRHD